VGPTKFGTFSFPTGQHQVLWVVARGCSERRGNILDVVLLSQKLGWDEGHLSMGDPSLVTS